MTEHVPQSNTESGQAIPEESGWLPSLPQLVWVVVSVVFLVYIAFGSIEARIWTYGRLTFQDRDITHVWRYFGDRLPEMPGGPIFPFLYYLSLAVMVIGTIAGLAMFLLTVNTRQESSETQPASGKASNE